MASRGPRTLLSATALTVAAMVIAMIWVGKSSTRAGSPDHCEVKAGGGFVMVVVCPPGLSDQDWREAGERACKGKSACNAWIWNDNVSAPNRSPTFDSPMTDAQADSAIAVWVDKARTLNVSATTGCY